MAKRAISRNVLDAVETIRSHCRGFSKDECSTCGFYVRNNCFFKNRIYEPAMWDMEDLNEPWSE